jgi:hypothetical protein
MNNRARHASYRPTGPTRTPSTRMPR